MNQLMYSNKIYTQSVKEDVKLTLQHKKTTIPDFVKNKTKQLQHKRGQGLSELRPFSGKSHCL